MAYGLFLYKEIINQGNRLVRIEIYQNDYVGASMEIEALQSATLVMDNQGEDLNSPIIKSSMNLTLVNTNQFNYEVFFTPDATKFKVVYKLDGVTEWTGYLTPDSYTENLAFRDTISLVARDNLGLLEQIKYDGADYLFERLSKVRSVIDHCLDKIQFPMSLEWISAKTSYLDGAVIPDINIADSLINAWQFIDDKTCFEVVEMILKSFALQMRYVGGNKYQIMDINDFISRPTSQDVIFVNGATREIIPAWKNTSLNFSYNKLENVYRGYLRENGNYIQGLPVTYRNFYWSTINTTIENGWINSTNNLRIYNPITANANPNWLYISGVFDGSASSGYNDRLTYRINVEKSNNPLTISYKAAKSVWYVGHDGAFGVGEFIRPSGAYDIDESGNLVWSNIQLRMRVRLITTSATYVLDKNWINESGYTGTGMIIFTYEGRKENDTGDQEITLTMTTIPEDGELRIEFYPFELFDVSEFSAQLFYDLVLPEKRLYTFLPIKELKIGFRGDVVSDGIAQNVVVNANANIKGEIELEYSQVPDLFGGFNFFGNGVFGDKGGGEIQPLIGWRWLGGTLYPLYEMCARHIIHNNYRQKNKYTGTFIVDKDKLTAPSFNALMVADNKNCVLNYASLDLLSEEMNAELIEVTDYDDVVLTFENTNKNWDL